MIRLQELTKEERAYLQACQPAGDLQALAERLRQHMVARLGGKISVSCLPGRSNHALPENHEPVIEIDQNLAAVWIAVRYGGKAETKIWAVRDAALLSPLVSLIRRALAETVINLGESASWPQSMCLQVSIGTQHGLLEIFWNSGQAMSWARQAIREKA